ncbi:MAG: hypothetical protein Q4C95_10805 [Planctomycetia bacterium]|nr:hypothetical protein [Planctomycetia bacterium]
MIMKKYALKYLYGLLFLWIVLGNGSVWATNIDNEQYLTEKVETRFRGLTDQDSIQNIPIIYLSEHLPVHIQVYVCAQTTSNASPLDPSLPQDSVVDIPNINNITDIKNFVNYFVVEKNFYFDEINEPEGRNFHALLFQDSNAIVSFIKDHQLLFQHKTDQYGSLFLEPFGKNNILLYVEDEIRQQIAQAHLVFVDDEELINMGVTNIDQYTENYLVVLFRGHSNAQPGVYIPPAFNAGWLIPALIPAITIPLISDEDKPISPSGR